MSRRPSAGVVEGRDAVRRLGRSLAAAVALIALLATTLTLTAGTAHAATTINVESGYGGFYRSGVPRPLRIVVSADRLIEGHIEVTVAFDGPIAPHVQRTPVQIAGGTTKEIVLVVPSVPAQAFGTRQTVRLVEGDTEIASTNVGQGERQLLDNELVGVFPGLADDAPERVESLPDLGFHHLHRLSPSWIAIEGALAPLDTIALTPAEFDALSDEDRGTLIRWAWRGGTLAAVGPDASALAGSFDGLGAVDGQQPFGIGAVHAIAEANWFEELRPTALEPRLDGPGSELFMNMFVPPIPISQTLAEDAGVELPSLPWLSALLVIYVLLAGPLAWFFFRRAGRTTALWLAIPTIALLFTGAVWVVGSVMRSGTSSAHATTIEVTPGGSYAITSQLLASRSGGVESLPIPDRWRLRGESTMPFMFGPFGSGDSGNAVTGEDMLDNPRVSATLDAGDFAVARLAGPVDGFDRALIVQAESSANGSVSGTVTNNLAVDLHEVGLFADQAGENLGTIAAGATVDFELNGRARDPFFGEPIDLVVWDEFGGGFFEPMPFPGAEPNRVQDDSAFSGGLWSEYTSAEPLGRQIGGVVVAGFTRDLSSPLDDEVTEGRTMIVARANITATAAITDLSVRSQPLETTTDFNGNGPPSAGAAWHFTLPQSWDPSRPVVLTLPRNLAQLEILDQGEWFLLDLETPSRGRRDVVELPASAFDGRNVYVRSMIDMRDGPPSFGPRAFVVRESKEDDTQIPYVAFDDGEVDT